MSVTLRTIPTTRSRFRPRTSVVVILAIALLCVLGFGYLWKGAGGTLPGGDRAYQVSFESADLKNLQEAGEVRVAGVIVGRVASTEVEGSTARVVLDLDDEVAPLHEGATVRVGVKSVIGQSFVDVKDGTGEEIPDGTTLSPESVQAATDIDEVVRTFTPQTRKQLAAALTDLGTTTDGTQQSITQVMEGLGQIGGTGYTAVDALAAQNDDLQSLVQETNAILAAADTNRGAIVSVIDNTQRITQATAGQQEALAATMQRLPGLMSSARVATGSLGELSGDLSPVVRSLDQAAPDLNAALVNLPSVTASLEALLPYMNGALKIAPETVNQLPALSRNLIAITPYLDLLLRNINPMLTYIEPYANDIGSFFGNFGGAFDIPLENGVAPARLATIFNEYSVRGNPLNLQTINPLHWNNPYPAPGQADEPAPFRGKAPRVEEDK